MRNTFNALALETAANGTSRPRISFVLGEQLFNRGTIEFRPSATEHDAVTAIRYDWAICDTERGVDLFAFEQLIATFSDWLAICHSSVPVVWLSQP